MKIYLRLVKYLFRYKIRLACVVMLSVLVAGTFGVQISTLMPVADVILDKDFNAEQFVNKIIGEDSHAVESADGQDKLDATPLNAQIESWKTRFWKSERGQRLKAYLIYDVFADRYGALVKVALFVIVVTVLGGVFRFLQQYNARYLATRLTIDVRNMMYRKQIRFSLLFFDRVTVGAMVSRFTNDVRMVNQGVISLFSSAVSHPLRIAVGLGMAFYLNAKLAIFGLILFPVAGFTFSYFAQQIRRVTKRALKRQASILSLLTETFGGIRIVKAFSMEDYEIDRFEKENMRLFRYFMKIAVADEMVKPLMEVIGVVGVVCFFVVGARQVLDGTMESSAFLLFNGALISCYEPVKKLSKVFTNIQKGVASGQRVFEIIDSDEIDRERPDAVELAPFNDTIRFENVSFRYGDGDAVLNNVNLEVRRGEIVAIVGASGAGKTTLVNLVPRFYDVTDGCVRIDGQDVRDVTLLSLRKQIAVVSQDIVLFNDTVRNNIAYGRADCDDELIVSASRAADADAFVRELPNGYDTVLAERGQSLSGGQKQRLAIARAIAKDPAILILDEATSSLDSESERAIQDALDRFIQGRTTLVIAHRLSTVLNADKIVVVDAGRVVGIGKHSELLDTNPVYRRLYEAQFRNGAGGTGQC